MEGSDGRGKRRRLISQLEERSTRLPGLLRDHLAEQPDLVPVGSTVLVALSGGSDSTALLLLLEELAPSLDLRIVAAHLDHGARPESAAEADRVSRRARGFGVRCRVGRCAAPPRLTQAALRAVRYRWLEQVRREEGAHRVALGHQADDQAETVLFRIMRGTDLTGLAGIPERRGSLVRPLLPFWRSQIKGYLRGRDVPWIDDPSNVDRRWSRTRIRAEVIPALGRELGDVSSRLVALSAAAARADEMLESLAHAVQRRALVSIRNGSHGDRSIVLSRDDLRAVHPELCARVLRRVVRELGGELTGGGTRAGVEFISRGRSGGRVDLGGSLQVSREYGWVVVGPAPTPEVSRPILVPRCEAGRGALRIGGRTWTVEWRPVDRVGGRLGRIAVPVPRGHYPLTIRDWRPGDRIRLAAGSRKLKKLFNEHRIPAGERHRVPVLVDSDDRVLWVAGVAVAAAQENTEYEESMLEFELADG